MIGDEPHAEYLRYRPEMPFTWQEMLQEKRILSPADTLRHLEIAYGYLVNTPGPHKEERRSEADDWQVFDPAGSLRDDSLEVLTFPFVRNTKSTTEQTRWLLDRNA